MRSSNIVGFRKTKRCPPSEALLLYIESTLAGERLDTINTHLCACDFCGAETQLLARFPQSSLASTPAREIPPALRRLAEEMLSRPVPGRAQFVETVCKIERLTLTDA